MPDALIRGTGLASWLKAEYDYETKTASETVSETKIPNDSNTMRGKTESDPIFAPTPEVAKNLPEYYFSPCSQIRRRLRFRRKKRDSVVFRRVPMLHFQQLQQKDGICRCFAGDRTQSPFRNEKQGWNERRNGLPLGFPADERRSGLYPNFQYVVTTMMVIASTPKLLAVSSASFVFVGPGVLWMARFSPNVYRGCSNVAPCRDGLRRAFSGKRSTPRCIISGYAART